MGGYYYEEEFKKNGIISNVDNYYHSCDVFGNFQNGFVVQAASIGTSEIKEFRSMHINTINSIRNQNGLPSFEEEQVIDNYAQQRAEDLAKTGELSHTGFEGSKIAPYSWSTAENLSVPISSKSGRDALVEVSNSSIIGLWKDSGTANFGHRKNILSTFVNKIGVGIAKVNGQDKYVVVENFGMDEDGVTAIFDKDPNAFNTYNDNWDAKSLSVWSNYTWDLSSGLAK